jgi:hypothetical protein
MSKDKYDTDGRVLTNREVISIGNQGGEAKCVIRKVKNGKKVVNESWVVECLTTWPKIKEGDKSATVRVGTRGSVTVQVPIDDKPFRQVVKGRGEVKLYLSSHSKNCGIF